MTRCDCCWPRPSGSSLRPIREQLSLDRVDHPGPVTVLAALEAEACEVPVVATRIGGIPEVVTDGETGFLSDIGDTEKMSDDVMKFLNDEEMRLEFGRKARESAISRYRSDLIIPQYIAFYESVLQKTRSAVA